MATIKNTAEWSALASHYVNEIKDLKISDFFNDSPNDLSDPEKRFKDLSIHFDHLLADFSKQKISNKTLSLLNDLAKKSGLAEAITNLVNGEKVNVTENRAALHTALRAPFNQSILLDDCDVLPQVQQELDNMSVIIDKITQANWTGFSGKTITDVVNIGVGGSDLGPLFACDALDEFKQKHKSPLSFHFASSIDGSQLVKLFESLNPETTLFVIISKSFTTIDTIANTNTAKAWLLEHCSDERKVKQSHFIGISANTAKMDDWGIPSSNQLKFWDWVGGRYSLWSTVGFCIALKIGMDNFKQLLAGANALDDHFVSAKWSENLPVLLGLIGVWNTNFLNINTQAILPYDGRLKYLPNYLTQLEMESNGKSVTINGESIDYNTHPIIWGEVGSNAQHAFYQLLHQGTRKVACDFIAPLKKITAIDSEYKQALNEQHLLNLANCFAQSRALMTGSDVGNADSSSSHSPSPHKEYSGDQPSTTLLLTELTPYSLGQLIALYEHKVFVMATIWGINPFDQWGVELGKTMAKETLFELKSTSQVKAFDASTNGLMDSAKSALL